MAINKTKTTFKEFTFDNNGISKIKDNKEKGQNWPVVYVLSGDKQAYVGETNNAYKRMNQHLENKKRSVMKRILLLLNDSFNKSATLDLENQLIQFMHADGKYSLQNENAGQSVQHNYYQRSMYQQYFQEIWDELKKKNLANKTLYEIKNSEIFKYSPYKQLTEDQFTCVESLLKATGDSIAKNQSRKIVIQGGAGTGKTVLAIYFIKCIMDLLTQNTNFDDIDDVLPEDSQILRSAQLIETIQKKKNIEIGYVVPASAFRGTVRQVFRTTQGLKASMVIGPNDVAKKHYDILIIDEAHRLKRRTKLNGPTAYKNFDSATATLGLSNDATQVDWMFADNRFLTVMFYDPKQRVNISDALIESFDKFISQAEVTTLSSQLRIEGGDRYIEFITNLLNNKNDVYCEKDYEVITFDDYGEMEKAIFDRNVEKEGLCRIVSGLAYPYSSRIRDKVAKKSLDIRIEGDGGKVYSRMWNIGYSDSTFITDESHKTEIGCVYTCQGYDLNYAGVILGPDIYFDVQTQRIDIDVSKHSKKDMVNIKGGDINVAKEHILNQYLVLLTRGIYGTYIYAVDKNLREYLKQHIQKKKVC